ncbi:hypothetical protein BC939DRAFT_504916 [Gamsiella multidivaricata]|uniref:uncharacterized protein n=1 Tax=Gamsiella multidivaricata TaxID=101098 RepID=UPI00221F2927|nr:uncharacterized protein BC939DRAFT_504916 [Gamsiella multidivaricata]KAI7820490.1 hypothetical protein BC939DRAFT_504916 [Gamsiella multidivaricata]
MEAVIKGILHSPTLQENVKRTAIIKLLTQIATLDKPDASILLDLGLELKAAHQNALENQTGDRILLAVSTAHRDLFWARSHNDWFENLVSDTNTKQDYARNIPLVISVARRKEAITLTEEEKQDFEKDMATLQAFAEKTCIHATPPLEYPIQCLFIAMFVALPATRPFATSNYIEFLVDHLANMPILSASESQGDLLPSKNAISLLQQCWENVPDNVIMTISHLFLNLANDERECSIGAGYILQAIPGTYTSVVDPFIQNLDSTALWRLKFTVQRLINWLVSIDLPGIGIWIVAIMESLASRGEFILLRELADQNAYKIARQLPFKARRNDVLLVLRFMLLGYYHSPVLFHNIVQGLIPLLVSCRKSSVW